MCGGHKGMTRNNTDIQARNSGAVTILGYFFHQEVELNYRPP